MDTKELTAKLNAWGDEFSGMTGVVLPSQLWIFLASRLCESGVVAADDDVVTLRTAAGIKQVRITSWADTDEGVVRYAHADGGGGFGMLMKRNFIDSVVNNSKLAAIVDRLEGTG